MTIRSSIGSSRDARAFLGRGIRSMFATRSDDDTAPPVDTEPERKKRPKTEPARR